MVVKDQLESCHLVHFRCLFPKDADFSGELPSDLLSSELGRSVTSCEGVDTLEGLPVKSTEDAIVWQKMQGVGESAEHKWIPVPDRLCAKKFACAEITKIAKASWDCVSCEVAGEDLFLLAAGPSFALAAGRLKKCWKTR